MWPLRAQLSKILTSDVHQKHLITWHNAESLK